MALDAAPFFRRASDPPPPDLPPKPGALAVYSTRPAALAALASVYDVDPVLAHLDWPVQRITAAAALRVRALLGRGGTPSSLAAAVRLIDPAPLGDTDLAFCDAVARDAREQSIAGDLAGRRWPVYAAPAVTAGRTRTMSRRLAAIDQRLADRLYAAAVTTMRDALRRAGIKARVRARNRSKEAQAALEADGMTGPILAAIAVTADELLDRAFDGYRTDAERWMAKAAADRRRVIARAYDLDDLDLDDDPTDHRAGIAAGLLAGLLLAKAKEALATTTPAVEPTVTVPFGLVRSAMRVKDGWTAVPTRMGIEVFPPTRDVVGGLIRQAAERAAPLPDLEALAAGVPVPVDLTGVVPEFVRHYVWVHGYFGEPASPFEPHVALDGEEYTDETRDFVLAKDPSEWPEGNYVWSVDDHDSCTCYEVVTWGPV